jgi:BlaI family penicillinase repressor
MAKAQRISDAEWQVMDVLWAKSPRTANEVVEALSSSGWGGATIKTMLNRLVRKRALKFRSEGKRYLYTPAITRDAAVRSEARSFLDRLFGGAVGPMLAHFVEDARLSRDEIDQLRKLLEKKGRS